MKMRVYTDEEVTILKQCYFVRCIKYKREIEYDPLFKIWTIMMRLKFPELTAREIFSKGGFDIDILNHNLPQRRIKTWLDNYRKFGIRYFFPEDEYYESICSYEVPKEEKDSFRIQLMRYVLLELKELDNGKK